RIAALFRRRPFKCRSRQFSDTLILPPTNHFANGARQVRTFVHGACHSSSPASFPQNFAGFVIDLRYSFWYFARLLISAFFAKDLGGSKTRVSTRCDSMFVLSEPLVDVGVVGIVVIM